MINIDINCDLGEGLDIDGELMTYITSCNIACGGHYGNAATIDTTIHLAKLNNVKIGAHPSFPDQENFGRVIIEITNQELKDSLVAQLSLFKERCNLQKASIHHVKPHGALYNLAAKNEEIATIVAGAVKETLPNAKLYTLPNPVMEKVANQYGIKVFKEAFADRNYNDDGSLVSRKMSNAVIQDKKTLVNHLEQMVLHNKVISVNNKEISMNADTYCIHGDNKKALELLDHLHTELPKKNISIL